MIRPADDRGEHQRQRDAERRAHGAGAEDVGGVLHFGRDEIERGGGEHEHVRERRDRHDHDQPGHRVDVEQAALGAGQRHPHLVEPAGVRPGEQDPADRAEIGRDDEGAEHHQPDEAFRRHVGARDRPGERHTEDDGEHRDAGAEHKRVPQRLQMPRAAVGFGVVGQSEAAGLGLLEAGDDQPHHRAEDEEHQDRDHRDPQDHARIGQPEAARERAFGGRREIVERGGHGVNALSFRQAAERLSVNSITRQAVRLRVRVVVMRIPNSGSRALTRRPKGNGTSWPSADWRSSITHQTCRATA